MPLIRPARPRRFAAIAAFAVLVAAGCGSSTGGAAAVVNGVSIEDSSVYALGGLDAQADTVSGSEFRDALSLLIIQQALLDAADETYGLGDLSEPDALEAFMNDLEPSEANAINDAIDAGVSQGRDPAATRSYVTTQQHIATAVSEAIMADPVFLSDVFTNSPELLMMVCARHILVATAEEADEVLTRLEAGEDFGAVAGETSLDTQSLGGALPCPASPFVFGQTLGPVLASVAVGELTGPVESEFGYHIIVVDLRDTPGTFIELTGDPDRWVPRGVIETELTAWYNDALARADIMVRSQIGTWNPQADAISPPPGSP